MSTGEAFPARELWRYVKYPRFSLADLFILAVVINVLRSLLELIV